MTTPISPIDRIEHWLNSLGIGEIPDYPEETLSRKEHFLKAAAEAYHYLLEHGQMATVVSDVDPTSTDEGKLGAFWYNKATGDLFILSDVDETTPYYTWDTISGGSGSTGIFVGYVTNGGSFPTTRLDGSALQENDYVRALSTSTFPFTIDTVTFSNIRDKAVHITTPATWVLDPGLVQDTAETPIKLSSAESISGTALYQNVANQEFVNASKVDDVTIDRTSDSKLEVKDEAITAAKLKKQASTDAGKAYVVQSDGSWALGETGSKAVMLKYDGTDIKDADGAVMTFASIKALLDDGKVVRINDTVTNTIMDYEAYEADCLWFCASYEISDVWNLARLTINSDNSLVYDVSEIQDKLVTTNQNISISTTNEISAKVDGTTIDNNSSHQLEIKDAGVSEAKIATDAVTTDKIKDSNVTTAKLADEAVTKAKIDPNAKVVYEEDTQTLTNKTIDADDNTIADLTGSNFKSVATTEAGKAYIVQADGTFALGATSQDVEVDGTSITKIDGKLAVKDEGITKAKIDPNAEVVYLNDTQTVTNKTVDADNNTVSNLTGANLKTQTSSEQGKTWVVQTDGTWALGTTTGNAVDNTTIDLNSASELEVKDGGISLEKLATQSASYAGKVYTINDAGLTALEYISQYKRVSTFDSVVGDTATAYYLDTDVIIGTKSYETGIYIWDSTNGFTLVANVGSSSTTSPTYVGQVSPGDVFPGSRPDGSALVLGDYVKPYSGSTFPFTIDGVTFTNARDTAVFMGSGHWLLNASSYQKTSETPIVLKTAESVKGASSTAVYQSDINTENATAINDKLDKATSTTDTKEYFYTHAGEDQYTDRALINDIVSTPSAATDTQVATAKATVTALATKLEKKKGADIPAAASTNVGEMYVCSEDSVDFKQGHIYKSVEDTSTTPSTYSWKDLSASEVEVDNVTIDKNASDQLEVKDAGLTTAKLTADSISTAIADATTAVDTKLTTEKAVRTELDKLPVTIAKDATAAEGYVATYTISQGGVELSPKINIPKDYLVKSGSVKTCTEDDKPVAGYKVGDKYLDFVVNVKEGTATDEHIYILVQDLVDVYKGSDTIDISTANEISVKDASLTKAKTATEFWTDNTLTGTTNAENIVVSGDLTCDGDTTIANGTVSGELDVPTPTTDNMAANKKYVDDSVAVDNITIDKTTDGKLEIKEGGVTTTRISDKNVTTDKIADYAVTYNKLADDSVVTPRIRDGAVTLAKLATQTAADEGKVAKVQSDGTWALAEDAGSDPDNVTIDLTSDNKLEVKDASLTTAKIDANTLETKDEGLSDDDTKIASSGLIKQVTDALITQYETMPTASADYVGDIAQFTGTSTTDYEQGFFYRCTEDTTTTPTTYKWASIAVQPSGAVQVDGTSISYNISGQLEVIDAGINNDKIADTAVTNDKIADATIENAKLAADSVDTLNIKDGAVSLVKLATQTAADEGKVAKVQSDGTWALEADDELVIDEKTIIENSDGKIETAVGGYDQTASSTRIYDAPAGTTTMSGAVVLAFNPEISVDVTKPGTLKVVWEHEGTRYTSDCAVTSDGYSLNGTITSLPSYLGNYGTIKVNERTAIVTFGDPTATVSDVDNITLTLEIAGVSYIKSKYIEVDGTTLTRTDNKINVANDGITATQIADGAVSTSELADNSVTGAKLGDTIVTAFQATPDDTHVPSEKMLKAIVGTLSGAVTVKVVETLPTSPDINTMYYVGTASPYHVYLIDSDGTQHDLGTTEMDLSGYLKLAGGTMTGTLSMSGTNPIQLNTSKVRGDGDDVVIENSTGTKVLDFSTKTGSLANSGTTAKTGATRATLRDATDNYATTNYPNVSFTAAESPTSSASDQFNVTVQHLSATYCNIFATDMATGKVYESSYKGSASASDWVENTKSDYLPLAGGTMTGQIKSSATETIAHSTNDKYTWVYGGTGYTGGAGFIAYGKDSSGTGNFEITAYDGTNRKNIVGKPDGTLTWNSTQLVSNTAGLQAHTDLRTVTGMDDLISVVNNYSMAFMPRVAFSAEGPTTTTSNTYAVIVCKYTTSYILVQAYNLSNGLIYTNYKTTAWQGWNETPTGSYLPLAGGTMTGAINIASPSNQQINRTVDNGYLNINGGTGSNKGAAIWLTGKDASGNNGAWAINAGNGTTTVSLQGKPAGTLTWNGNQVETIDTSANTGKYIADMVTAQVHQIQKYSDVCFAASSSPDGSSSSHWAVEINKTTISSKVYFTATAHGYVSGDVYTGYGNGTTFYGWSKLRTA